MESPAVVERVRSVKCYPLEDALEMEALLLQFANADVNDIGHMVGMQECAAGLWTKRNG
jgi:hypothetical protein